MNPLGGGSPLGVDFKFARILVVVLYIFFGANLASFISDETKANVFRLSTVAFASSFCVCLLCK